MGQAADSSGAPQDTATVDSAVVARLQEELNWRTLIRVRANSAWFELAKPSVSPLGIDYESLSFLEPSLKVPRPVRPIPLPMVLEIRVRKGHPKAGMIVGGVVSTALILRWAESMGEGDDDFKPEACYYCPSSLFLACCSAPSWARRWPPGSRSTRHHRSAILQLDRTTRSCWCGAA